MSSVILTFPVIPALSPNMTIWTITTPHHYRDSAAEDLDLARWCFLRRFAWVPLPPSLPGAP